MGVSRRNGCGKDPRISIRGLCLRCYSRTPAETRQVKSMDTEMASIVEERLANMIRWMGRHRPVTLRALSFTMRRTGCQR